MTPLKLIRSLGKIVRGGAGPSQVFLGCLLGVMIGMTPGFNLTLVLGIVLFLVLNANFGLMLLGVVLGKVLMYALAPLTYGLGRVAVEDVARGLFASLANTPVLALMDPGRYCLVGGLIVGAVVGAVMGLLLARAIVALRRGVLAAQQKSGKVAKAGQNIVMRIFLRLVFGKLKKPLAEALETKPPLLRKSGIIIIVVLVALVAAGELLLANVFFKDMLQGGLESANGAEVNLDKAGLSILGGSIDIKGLRVTDRNKPEENSFEADSIVADVSVSSLLSGGWFVVDELSGDPPRFGVKRDKPGKVFDQEGQPAPGQAATQPGGTGTGAPGQEDKPVRDEAKEREQLNALRDEAEKKLKAELDKLTTQYIDQQIDKQLAKLKKLPESVRAEAKKKVETEVKQRIDTWTSELAKELAARVMEQVAKQDKFADFADEALKYRKYLPYLEKARKELAKRKAARENDEEYQKQLQARIEAEGYLAQRADLVSRPPWLIRKVSFEGFSFGQAGTYSLTAQNITGRPELADGPMDVRVTRTGGFDALLKYGFAEGDFYGPTLSVSLVLSVKDMAGSKLPEWASQLTFECRFEGGLNSTPRLKMDWDKAIAELRTKVVANIEAEVKKQVEKAVKDQTGGLLKGIDLPGVLKGKDGKKPDPKDLLKGVLDPDKDKDKDKKKPDPGDLLKGVLGGDKDKDKDKDKKPDPLKDIRNRL